MSEFDIIFDSSQQNLKQVPPIIFNMRNLKMLYLQQNLIEELPEDFFDKLPLLTWLDLRKNYLTHLPKNIGFHQNLENLLLSDNRIQELPNELGKLPKLKVLQVANNPLSYPNSKVIAEGTKVILRYLKNQIETNKSIEIMSRKPSKELSDEKILNLEKEIRVMADYTKDQPRKSESVNSSLMVKGLSSTKLEEPGIVHKISKTSNKIFVKSYYEEEKYSRASTQTGDSITRFQNYKHTWLDKLKELLDQQERILQQERNLQTLANWRSEKRSEPIRHIDKSVYQKPPPYDTDPQYQSILSREDMHKELNKMIQNNKNPPKKKDIEKLISDLISQLKEMETSCGGLEFPRSEIEAAGSQIKKIMEMHKKILELQDINKVHVQ